MKPLVTIVGRPNVGKSTLFNRLIQQRLAIVEDVPGVTRDRLYADVEWQGHTFQLADTGGIRPPDADPMARPVVAQARVAIDASDLILFVVDGSAGPTAGDEEVADLLRRASRPLLLVVNKIDHPDHEARTLEFHRLGLGEPHPVSAVHGRGTGDLLDRIVERLPETAVDEEPDLGAIRVALTGRPNVGKSSLLNRLVGAERVLVSETPGTTRDAVDVHWEFDGRPVIFVDTAGIRRRSRVEEGVERYSVLRALRSVDRSDVVTLLLDATEGVSSQDQRLAGYADERGRALILAVNKWDLVEKTTETASVVEQHVRRRLPFADYAPVLFVSAKTGQRLRRLIQWIFRAADSHSSRVPTGPLNRALREIAGQHPPPSAGGRSLRIYYGTQTDIRPPTFTLFCNDPDLLTENYRRFLSRRLRQQFGFEATPVRLRPRPRSS